MNKRLVFLSALMAFVLMAACTPAAEEAEMATPADPADDTAMADAAGDDPLTGTWSGDWGPSADHRNPVTLELSWNGTALSGTVNPGAEPLALETATFDPATGSVTMEAGTTNFRGEEVHYMISGQVEGSTMSGSWTHEGAEGDFSLTRN